MITRPFQSEVSSSPFAGRSIEYDASTVIRPDVVSWGIGYVAAHMTRGRYVGGTLSVAEIGCGAAPFLSVFAGNADQQVALSVLGIDNDRHTIPYATYNIERFLSDRANPLDSYVLKNEDWSLAASGKGVFDVAYFNPPFLAEGEVVRPGYGDTPKSSMFVADSRDGLDHYRSMMVTLVEAIRPKGLLCVRAPRVEDRKSAVSDIIQAAAGDDMTIHSIRVESELGDRVGGGFIVEMCRVHPIEFEVGLIRTKGLGITKGFRHIVV